MSYTSYLSYRVAKTAKIGTADFTDWGRFGAGYRRQDCQNKGTADFTDLLQIKGVLAHAGRVFGSLEV